MKRRSFLGTLAGALAAAALPQRERPEVPPPAPAPPPPAPGPAGYLQIGDHFLPYWT